MGFLKVRLVLMGVIGRSLERISMAFASVCFAIVSVSVLQGGVELAERSSASPDGSGVLSAILKWRFKSSPRDTHSRGRPIISFRQILAEDWNDEILGAIFWQCQ